MGNRALGFTVDQENTIWEMWRRGDSLSATGRVLGESVPQIGRFLRKSGGIRPLPRRRRASHLTAGEREEISRGIAAGDSARTIADKFEDPRPRSLGRSPATAAANTIGRPRRMPQRMSARAALKSRLSLPGIFCGRLSQGS